MTYIEVINFIMKRLGGRVQLKSLIETEMQFVKDYVMENDPQIKPWFLLHNAFQTVTTVADQNYVDLPTDFKAVYEDGFMYLSDGVTEVFKESFDIRTAKSRRADEATELSTIPVGENPTAYSLDGTRLHLFPTPIDARTLNLRYYRKTGDLAEEATNPWLVEGADWLLNEAGAAVAESIQNKDQFAIFQARAIRARHRIMAETEERRLENHPGLPQ